MAKRIVFCADGTWNGPEKQTGVAPIDSVDEHGELQSAKVTNVVKLFANLGGRVTPQTMTLRDEQEKVLADAAGATVQIAKYVHGVGNSESFLKKAMGGMFGMGVIARIVRGYTFISRHYDPGDEIHIVGFSRGAYTARALAGMISSVGLLNRAEYDADGHGRSVSARRRSLVQVQEHVAAWRRQAHRPGEPHAELRQRLLRAPARRGPAHRKRADQVRRGVGHGRLDGHSRLRGGQALRRVPLRRRQAEHEGSARLPRHGDRRAARGLSGHGMGQPRRRQASVVRRRARRRRRRLHSAGVASIGHRARMDHEAARGGRRATRNAAHVQAGAVDRSGNSSALDEGAVRAAATRATAGHEHGHDSR